MAILNWAFETILRCTAWATCWVSSKLNCCCRPGLELEEMAPGPSELLGSMGMDTEGMVPLLVSHHFCPFCFWPWRNSGTLGRAEVEGEQNTYGAQLWEFMCAVVDFLPVSTELWRSVFPVVYKQSHSAPF